LKLRIVAWHLEIESSDSEKIIASALADAERLAG